MIRLRNKYIEGALEYIIGVDDADLGKLSSELVRLTISGTTEEIDQFDVFIDYLVDMGFLSVDARESYNEYLKALRNNLIQQLNSTLEKLNR